MCRRPLRAAVQSLIALMDHQGLQVYLHDFKRTNSDNGNDNNNNNKKKILLCGLSTLLAVTQSVLFLLNSVFSITRQQEDISAGSVYKKLFQSAACRDERECAPCCPADVLQLVPCFQFRLFIATSTFLEELLGRDHRHTRDAHLCLTMLVDFAKQRPLKMLFIFKTGSNFCNSSCLSDRVFS